MKALTRRQSEVFEFIKAYIETHKYPPTIREVSEHFKISIKGGYDHIKAIEKKKYIRCNLNKSRAIEILQDKEGKEKGITSKKIPVLGTVVAGKPFFTEENFEGEVDIPPSFVGSGSYFALTVRGDSMVGAGILEGDMAIINHQNYAENGEIVVAMVDDAVTLKRLYKEKNRIKLKAENSAYPPIYSQNVKILGKLSCLLRNYA